MSVEFNNVVISDSDVIVIPGKDEKSKFSGI